MKRYFTYLFTALLLTVLLSLNSAAQVNLSDLKNDLPKMLGANNVGKEFWFAVPPCYEDESGGHDNFVKIYVTSPVKTLVRLEVPGKSFLKTQMTIPNDIIEFNIPAQIAQPFSKGGHDPAPPDQVYRGAGFHITADQPLVVYVIVRYWYTSDGFLAIPVSSLGKDYVCASYPDMSAMYGGYYFPSEVTITAAHPDTKVNFTLGGNIFTKTASGTKPGQTVKATLQPGDVWAISSSGAEADLTGSRVFSSKPVSVVSGNQCTNIPTNNRWCDYTVEADLPTYTWGTDYHVGKVPKRKFPSIVRVFAKEPDTKFYRDGNQIGVIPNGPGGTLGNGWQEFRMSSIESKPRSVVISGDKPIAVTLYNCGVEEDGYPLPNSDPFVMSITPVQQYQKEITFCTPGVNGSGFPENYINVVYQTNEFGMIPDDLEFAEVNSGQFIWYKMKSKFSGTDEMFAKQVNNNYYAVKTITLPKDGVYKIRAKQPFACYSFGYSYCDSYGYPTSAALADLEKPDTLCPLPLWTMTCDGRVEGATVEDMPRDPEVRSNLAMIVLHSDSTFNFDFEYKDFEPGAASTTTWKLTVVDPTKDAFAKITFMDRRGNDTTISVRYIAVKLDIEPKFTDWGTLKMGESVTKDFEGINLSKESSVLIDKLKLRSGAEGFEIVNAPKLPFVLPADSRFKFQIKFTATAEGSFKDSVGLGDTCFFWNKAFIKAKVGEPIIEVTDIDFGDQRVNLQTGDREMYVKNVGTVDLTITDAQGPFIPNKVYKTDLETPTVTKPLIIPPGGEFKFMVNFTPDAVKSFPDSIVFVSDARSRKNVGYLKGRGIEPGLEANSYDWGRRRITRTAFPTGPYPADNPNQIITLKNSGTMRVKINGLKAIGTPVNDAAFEFDRAQFDNMAIEPGETKFVEVKFHPSVVGDHEFVFEYINDANSTTRTTLKGTGILPRVATHDYNFDTTMINDKLGPKTRTIVFENSDYNYGDDLTITDFKVGNGANDINPDFTKYGSEGFNYDKASIKLPVVIKRGQSISFDAKFMAQRVNGHAANLTSVSDAEADVTSKWNGWGLSPGINVTTTNVTICTGTTAEITVQISNTGTGDLDVTSIDFETLTGNLFSFKDPNDAKGFTLQGKGSGKDVRTITLVFNPGAKVGLYKNVLIIKNTTQTQPEVRVDISSTSVHYAKTATVVLPADKDKNPVIAQEGGVDVRVDVSNGDDIKLAKVTKIQVKLSYNNNWLKLKDGSLRVGDDYKNTLTLANSSIDEKAGTITATLVATSGEFNGTGKLLNYNFNTFLPQANGTDVSDFKVELVIVDGTGACVDITNVGATSKQKPTCVYDIRKIIINKADYMLSDVQPNPVSTSTKIKFGIGLETATDIIIVNSNGQIVAQPVNGVYKPGEYEIDLNVQNMNSGVYYIKMNSGPFTATKELVITK